MKKIHSQIEFQCPWFSIGYDLIRLQNGAEEKHYWVDRPQDSVGIVAINEHDIVMVKTHRPKLESAFWECPGGHLEDGETYTEAARRELKEETGISANHLDNLFTYHPTSIERYKRGIIVATDLQIPKDPPPSDEIIEWKFVHSNEALTRAKNTISTGWTVTALLAAKEEGYI